MFLHPPREHPAVSWFIVAVWTLLIYCTIPLARTIQGFVRERWGAATFTWIVVVALGLGLLAAFWTLRSLRGRGSWRNIAWLLAVSAAFGVWTWHIQKRSPEEALHFIEYGVLAMLIFRAFATRWHHHAIYPAALLTAAIIGTVDEFIQWLTPRRFWDLRDVWLNAGASGLVLLAIGRGLTPVYLVEPVSRRAVRVVYVLGLVLWAMVASSLFNTPRVRVAYQTRLPWIKKITRSAHVMSQYGFRFEDPAIGVFKSRFSPEELARADREQAGEAAAILDRYHDHSLYEEFLKQHTAYADPFVHEARVHLFRRDRYRHSATRYVENDPQEYRRHLTIAHRENQIMERYFSNTMAASEYTLRPETVAHTAEHLDTSYTYQSPVSQSLITRFRPSQVAWIQVAILAGWTVLCGSWRRRAATAV